MEFKKITTLIFASLIVLSLLGMTVTLSIGIYSAIFDHSLNLNTVFTIFWMSTVLLFLSIFIGSATLKVFDDK